MKLPALTAFVMLAFARGAPAQNDRPSLCDAVRKGDLAAVAAAAAGAASLDEMCGSRTPLMWAAYAKRVDVFKLLLAAGADPTKGVDSGEGTVAHLAACDSDPTMIELLAAAHAPLDVNSETVGGTPLHVAAFQGHAATVAALLAHGARVDARGELGRTPLHLAAFAGHLEVVRELLAHGADRALVDAMGRNPAHLACEAGRDSVMEELYWGPEGVQPSLSLEQADQHGWTPLALAAAYGRERCCAIVGYHGLTPTKETGRSPLHWACFGGNLRSIESLLDLLGVSPRVPGSASVPSGPIRADRVSAPDAFGQKPLDLLVERVPTRLAHRLGSTLAPADVQELRALAEKGGAIAIQVRALLSGMVAAQLPRNENGITLAVWNDGLVLFVTDRDPLERVGRIPPPAVERALAECADFGLFDQPERVEVGLDSASKRVTLARNGARCTVAWDGSLGTPMSDHLNSARRSFEDAWFLMESAFERLVPSESITLKELAADGRLRGFGPDVTDIH